METETSPAKAAHSCPKPINMVFEGGGVLGAAYIGVIEELDAKSLWKSLRCFAGASIGAITAIICACKPSIAQIKSILSSVDVSAMLDRPCFPIAAYNLITHKGICPGTYAHEWLRTELTTLCGDPDITLGSLEERFDTKLTVCVLNVTKRRVEYITGKTHPQCSVALLGRAAMSISMLFIPVDLFGNGDLYVDGGMLNNYPIQCFHYQTPTADTINPNTIGCMLFTDAEVQTVFPPIGSIIDWVLVHLNLIWSWPEKQYMDDQDWARTIKVRTGNVSSLDFNITSAQIADLVERGREGVRDWCAGKHTNIQKQLASAHTPEDESPRKDA